MIGKRILITGVTGRLGSRLAALLENGSNTVMGFDRSALDITDWATVRQVIANAHPDIVINAAAMTDVDGCARDPALAHRINGLGAGNVAAAAYAARALIVHISTNEVFDGSAARPYREYDAPCPINPYGESKWAGEQAVIRVNPRHVIVRTAWLFAHGGRNFVHAILGAARAGKPLRVVCDEVANPTYTYDLADAIITLAQAERPGIYHLVNEGTATRSAFARRILDRSGYADTPITPILRAQWPRPSCPPAHAALDNTAAALLGIRLRPWHAALDSFLEREGLLA
ncbi:MAG: dTDP-4-dehydrorhamnose reductase [Chloroflexota bacterium]|nr:MAG: dTDP-4-dehydrorhamnose reductase [Chloroflexi bacterium OLB13]MEB2367401.1 dTDP-4-dehydrorhamnose reductase [Chloroflexota bacterium]